MLTLKKNEKEQVEKQIVNLNTSAMELPSLFGSNVSNQQNLLLECLLAEEITSLLY